MTRPETMSATDFDCSDVLRGNVQEGQILSILLPVARHPLRPDGFPKLANTPQPPAVPMRAFLPEDAAKRRRARGRKMSNRRGEFATTIDPGLHRRRRAQGTRAIPPHPGTKRPRRNRASRVRARDDARWIEDRAILALAASDGARRRSRRLESRGATNPSRRDGIRPTCAAAKPFPVSRGRMREARGCGSWRDRLLDPAVFYRRDQGRVFLAGIRTPGYFTQNQDFRSIVTLRIAHGLVCRSRSEE